MTQPNDHTIKRIKDLENLVLDLQKRLSWAQENADMCRISMNKYKAAYEQQKDLAETCEEQLNHTQALLKRAQG